jgi:hypothetical protein
MDHFSQMHDDLEKIRQARDASGTKPEPVKAAIKAALDLCAAMIKATKEFIDKIAGAQPKE